MPVGRGYRRTPTPLTRIGSGRIVRSVSIPTIHGREPAAVGANVTSSVQVPLTGRGTEPRQVPEAAKSFAASTAVILIGSLSVFLKTSVRGSLVVPIARAPKSSASGETVRTAMARRRRSRAGGALCGIDNAERINGSRTNEGVIQLSDSPSEVVWNGDRHCRYRCVA